MWWVLPSANSFTGFDRSHAHIEELEYSSRSPKDLHRTLFSRLSLSLSLCPGLCARMKAFEVRCFLGSRLIVDWRLFGVLGNFKSRQKSCREGVLWRRMSQNDNSLRSRRGASSDEWVLSLSLSLSSFPLSGSKVFDLSKVMVEEGGGERETSALLKDMKLCEILLHPPSSGCLLLTNTRHHNCCRAVAMAWKQASTKNYLKSKSAWWFHKPSLCNQVVLLEQAKSDTRRKKERNKEQRWRWVSAAQGSHGGGATTQQ